MQRVFWRVLWPHDEDSVDLSGVESGEAGEGILFVRLGSSEVSAAFQKSAFSLFGYPLE